MVDRKKNQKSFGELNEEDLDLTMFTITNLTLKNEKYSNTVYKDKDKDKDKDKNKDKDKVQIGPNMCYIFEKLRAQGCEI